MVDPVCWKDVDLTVHTDETQFGGRTVYFCSPECKKKFEENPEAYPIVHSTPVLGEMHKFEI